MKLKPTATLKVTTLFPSSSPTCEPSLKEAKTCLESYRSELEILWPRKVRARRKKDPTDYLAGSDQARSCELLEFLRAEEPKVAWFGRGGYGATRLLGRLEKSLEVQAPVEGKRWMGYSDITALFSFCKVQRVAVECLHGPMLCSFPKQPNKTDILSALNGLPVAIPFLPQQRKLRFEGTIWGGNLAVLASLCGTPFLAKPESEEAIFLEDVDEAPYRVDRYLTQLYDSGFFHKSKRIILGTFTGYTPHQAVYRTARERCKELGLEVLGQIPAGHSEPHYPLFLDKPYRFCADSGQLLPQF